MKYSGFVKFHNLCNYKLWAWRHIRRKACLVIHKLWSSSKQRWCTHPCYQWMHSMYSPSITEKALIFSCCIHRFSISRIASQEWDKTELLIPYCRLYRKKSPWGHPENAGRPSAFPVILEALQWTRSSHLAHPKLYENKVYKTGKEGERGVKKINQIRHGDHCKGLEHT